MFETKERRNKNNLYMIIGFVILVLIVIGFFPLTLAKFTSEWVVVGVGGYIAYQFLKGRSPVHKDKTGRLKIGYQYATKGDATRAQGANLAWKVVIAFIVFLFLASARIVDLILPSIENLFVSMQGWSQLILLLLFIITVVFLFGSSNDEDDEF
jgi:hypothetical protein